MNDRLAVYMLDVGQGDSSIVLLPDGRVVIFDCKDDHVLRSILDGWKAPEVAAFVLSHLDQDHIAGALQFLQGYLGRIHCVHMCPDRDVGSDHGGRSRSTGT